MSGQPILLVDVADGVAVMTINRPEAMNAVSLVLREEVIALASVRT